MSDAAKPEVVIPTPAPTAPPKKKKWRWWRRKEITQVHIYSYPPLIFLWPPCLMGYICWLLATAGVDGHILSWVWFISWVPSIFALGGDIDRDKAFIWGLALALIIAVLVILSLLHVYFGWARFLIRSATYDPVLGLRFSVMLTLFYLFMLPLVFLNNQWEINSNQWEHRKWGKTDESITHGSKTMSIEIPDVFQWLLCGSGDIIIKSPDGKTEHKRIPNVPFVASKWRRIDALIERVQVGRSHPVFDDEDQH